MQNRDERILQHFYNSKEFVSREDLVKKLEEEIAVLKSTIYEQTDEEKELYKKFCEIAEADPDQKFKFEHVDRLGIGADVVVIYGKKGIGKTYQISKIIHELSEQDPNAEVILMRNTVSEFQALEKQLSVHYCPIYMKGRTTNNPNLYHKWLFDAENPEKPRYMGFCTALTGFSLESAKGAEYPNTRLIIWDECTNMGTGNAGYDKADINRFITFFDSIIRNKTNVKIYIFGNFHRNTDGKVSDVLLDTLQIPYACSLKIKEASSKDQKSTSKLLFINTGSLYSGIDANAKVNLFGDDTIQEDLFGNMPQSYSNMIGGLNIFYSHTPMWGLLFQEGEFTYLLLLSKFKGKKGKTLEEHNWMIHMEEAPNEIKFVHNIFTTNSALYNEWNGKGVEEISDFEEYLCICDLHNYCQQKSLYYSSDVTRVLFQLQMTKWKQKYKLGINVSFLNNEQFLKLF